MLHTKQLADDLEALQTGRCWIGYNATEVLEGIDFELAQKKLYPNGNTIWQIVNHISYWREITASRLREKKGVEEEKTGMDMPDSPSDAEWVQGLLRFNEAYVELRNAILQFDGASLQAPADNHGSFYFNITGCMQHDAFHLGQIMLVKRAFLPA